MGPGPSCVLFHNQQSHSPHRADFRKPPIQPKSSKTSVDLSTSCMAETLKELLKFDAQVLLQTNYTEFLGMDPRYWYFLSFRWFQNVAEVGNHWTKEPWRSYPEIQGQFVGCRWYTTMKCRAGDHCRDDSTDCSWQLGNAFVCYTS